MIKALFKPLVILLVPLSPFFVEAKTSVEFRTDAFFPTQERFTDIYGDISPSYSLEVATKIYRSLDAWANFDWFTKDGESIGFNDPTTIDIGNFSLGLKASHKLAKKFWIYGGIGPSFSKVWIKNTLHNSHEDKDSKFAFGGVIKTGVNYFFTKHIFLDLFVDYLYLPVHFEHYVNLGGFKLGGGIGVKF